MREMSVTEQRYKAVLAVIADGRTVSEVASEWGVCRQTMHRWLARYEGDGLELNDVLREFVLLALPMQKLCNENCKGICPVCGQNRNQNECRCQNAADDNRWAALKELRK